MMKQRKLERETKLHQQSITLLQPCQLLILRELQLLLLVPLWLLGIVLQHLLLIFRLRHLGHLLRLRFLVLLLCVIQSMEDWFVAIAQMRGNLIATSANYLTPTLKLWS
jgi:hypothetical protein